MKQEGGRLTIVLDTEQTARAALDLGLAAIDLRSGAVAYHPAFLVGVAHGRAEALGGRILRTWNDGDYDLVEIDLGQQS